MMMTRAKDYEPKVTPALLRAYLRKHPTANGQQAADHFKVTRQRVWQIAQEAGIRLAGARIRRAEGL